MNKELGTKWFVFYTKVRPAFAILSMFSLFFEFLLYADVYFSNIFLALYFLGTVANVVLAIIVAVKSNGDYKSFVRFVKYVLIFEVINTSYQVTIKRYVNNENAEVIGAILTFAVLFVILYFLWYKLNINYFERRILKENTPYMNIPYDVTMQTGGIANFSQVENMQYCRYCGNMLTPNPNYCSKCGNRVDSSNE